MPCVPRTETKGLQEAEVGRIRKTRPEDANIDHGAVQRWHKQVLYVSVILSICYNGRIVGQRRLSRSKGSMNVKISPSKRSSFIAVGPQKFEKRERAIDGGEDIGADSGGKLGLLVSIR
ncbi:hypothetical protein GH714_020922 [Hevea brasiliensis]|uniref:Uncharacterized protein n=1 Tax=Hevea brasiliensis TaxID=3981 RepID=A0A6A6L9Z3_HEVBR|nr:hypothetical protein GH714_020922 [Hevea brasiliensis]